MTPEPTRHRAAVVATCADAPTQFVYAAAEQVVELIRADGRFTVEPFLPYEPHRDLESHWRATGGTGAAPVTPHHTPTALLTPANYRLAYFSTHGLGWWASPAVLDRGVGLTDLLRGGTPFMNFWDGAHFHPRGHRFTSSILVMTACLLDGALPNLLCARPDQVQAVIGYSNTFHVINDPWLQRCLGGNAIYLADYTEFTIRALVQPVRSLLEGRTATEAVKATRGVWDDLSARVGSWGVDPRVRNIVMTNRERLRVWPECSQAVLQSEPAVNGAS